MSEFLFFPLPTAKDSLDTNRIDAAGQQQQRHRPQPARRPKPLDADDNAVAAAPTSRGPSVADVTAATVVVTDGGGGNTALTSPKRGDEPEEMQVPAHGAFFFALGCGSALIVTLVAVTSALAYRRTTANKTLSRSRSKESLQ